MEVTERAGEVDLVAALESLRRQLSKVAAGRAGSDIGFDIRRIELELKVGVRALDGKGGNVGFKLFGVGLGAKGSASVANEQVQTLRLQLRPIRGTPESEPAAASRQFSARKKARGTK